MIVRTRQNTQVIQGKTWESERLLLKNDNLGFSFHITTMQENTSTKMQYKNHLESVYCIRGKGLLTDLENNQQYEINPGTIYALEQNDKHILEAITEMELACVFNPACTGTEMHNEEGSYDL